MNSKIQDDEKSIEWYIANRSVYKKLALKVENIIKEIADLKEVSYHMITSRTKDLESFKTKIEKEKYDDPVNQIKDLAGVRIITYVEDEVQDICKIIEDTFDIDIDHSLDKSKELGLDKVGYKSVHYVGKLKEDRLELPEYSIFKNKFFEVQIRTILQHAWAEIEHDRNYKFSGILPDEIRRRFKLLAGSLEICDREFNNIAREIDIISKEVETGTKQGKLNFEINSTSLKQYIDTKFIKLKEAGLAVKYHDDEHILKEMGDFGIKTLQDLDNIIPKDYIQTVIKSEAPLRESIPQVGLIRSILIISDADKYFTNAWKNGWKVWSNNSYYKEVFKHYKIDWEKISKKYEVVFTDISASTN